METITIENYHECYGLGKRIADRTMEMSEAATEMVALGMSEKSARYYLQCVKALLSGERFTATVKQNAISYFLTQIYTEKGADGLKVALSSLRQHLDYQKGKNSLPGIESIYQDFFEIL